MNGTHPSYGHRALAEVRAQVRDECSREGNRLGVAFFDQHLERVVDYALRLAPALQADPLQVELAAWLHDLSAVRDFTTLPVHAEESARIARTLLAEQGWPAHLIDGVAAAIATHSAPVALGQGTPEQVCLSCADVMSQLARPIYWCFYLYQVRGLPFGEGQAWLRQRAGAIFEALPSAARELVAEERAAVARLIGASAAATERDWPRGGPRT